MRHHSRLRLVIALALMTLLAAAACGDSSGSTTTKPETITTTTTSTVPPAASADIVVLPEFIQGVIPGASLMLLVTPADPSSGAIAITAAAAGAGVDVEPAVISGTQVAEVTFVPPPSRTESTLVATITATAGDDTREVTREVTVMPWDDDRRDEGAEVLGLFTPWLAEHHPEFGITPDTVFSGTHVAPMLLIVNHYCFLTDEWEVGVSWHVMVPPDDFAEIYLRPRDGLRPTGAFRIGSWQTALETGEYEVVPVAPPGDVVR